MIENSQINNNGSASGVDNIVLALDGESIILKNLAIRVEYDLPEEDQSGGSSSTNSSENGIKPKKLAVSGLIEHSAPDRLRRLIELSYQTEIDGTKKLYRVANATANVMNLREAVFSGRISVSPHSTLLAWQVEFVLSERKSVPEKRELRGRQRAVENGDEHVGAIIESVPADENEALSWFEKNILANVDDVMG
ncbi:hypothetical protein A9G48_05040 [Gilliamella sp. wkB18]|uniref:baseplate complex protein n=1 Tax=Gilliamella sp. wkB18 TaxID=3120260 RepID=UPI00080DC425|nr:hypothetical protein [Gilliamella apicola]OCG63826.1 hypothetical protein A9G48_05040 [Gilliamella apicola]